jgi:hypothetical protein
MPAAAFRVFWRLCELCLCVTENFASFKVLTAVLMKIKSSVVLRPTQRQIIYRYLESLWPPSSDSNKSLGLTFDCLTLNNKALHSLDCLTLKNKALHSLHCLTLKNKALHSSETTAKLCLSSYSNVQGNFNFRRTFFSSRSCINNCQSNTDFSPFPPFFLYF